MVDHEPDAGAQDTLADDLADVLGWGQPASRLDLDDDAPPADAAAAPADAAPEAAPTDGAPAADDAAAIASPDTTDDAAGEPPAAPDPLVQEGLRLLEDAAPATYTVDGETRTVDGMLVREGEGAILDADAVPAILRRLSERDQYEAALRSQQQQDEPLHRIAQWTVQDATGKTTTYHGAEAVQVMHTANAQSQAVVNVFGELFKDPNRLAEFLSATENPDGSIAWAFRPEAQRALALAIRNASLEAQNSVRERLGSLTVPAAQTGPLEISPEQGVQIATEVLKAQGVTGLSAGDLQALGAQVGRYTSRATAEDVARNPSLRVGEPVVDRSFLAIAQRMAAGAASRAKDVKDAARISAANDAKLRQARTAAPASPPAPAAPKPTPDRGAQNFASRLAAANGQFPRYAESP